MNFLIKISGGSGSNKTTLAKKIAKDLGQKDCLIISQDDYMDFDRYNNISDECLYRWDHPEIYHSQRLVDAINKLLVGQRVSLDSYCPYESEAVKTVELLPKKYILLEGIYANYSQILNQIPSIKIHVSDYLFARLVKRLVRNVARKAWADEEVILNNFLGFVSNAHLEFVSKQKELSDYEYFSPFDFGYYTHRIEDSRRWFADNLAARTQRISLSDDFYLDVYKDSQMQLSLFFGNMLQEFRLCSIKEYQLAIMSTKKLNEFS